MVYRKYDEIDPCIEDIYHKCTFPLWLTNLRATYLKYVKKVSNDITQNTELTGGIESMPNITLQMDI